NLRHRLLQAGFPRGHLGRMHPVRTGSCMDGFEPFERFECYTGFKLGAVLFPLCRHLPSPHLHLLWTQHSILITCPVFGVHYRVLYTNALKRPKASKNISCWFWTQLASTI